MVYCNQKKVKKGRNSMALIQANFVSNSLKRTVPIQVILPADKIVAGTAGCAEPKPFKTLYLLHGLLGNYTDWVTNTRLQQWAEAKDLAVVMPSGDNSFYVDLNAPNSNYGEFIGKELVQITRRMFPLSRRREDTFIAGLSMGGYGAIRNGLVCSETFSRIAGLSSAVHFFEAPPDKPGQSLMGEEWVFGCMQEARLTDKNPRVALAQLKKRGAPVPEMYLACGLQDSLLEANRSLKAHFEENGIPITYEETEGGHTWDFWNSQIRKVLDWLLLEDAAQGLNSGNVSVTK